MHPCLKTREDVQKIVPTGGEGHEEDIQGDINEEPVMVNQHAEHDHEGDHDKHNVQDEPFPESQSKAQVEVVVVGHLV